MTAREMALRALQARDEGDRRWADLLASLALRTGLSYDQVEAGIVRLSL